MNKKPMDETWMTIPKMMEYMSISRKTAYKLIRDKKIPSYRISARKTLVKKEDIDKYIIKHRN